MHPSTTRTGGRERGQALRDRLRDQGFEVDSAGQAAALAPHLRWTTGICGTLLILGVVFQYAPLIWALAPLSLVAAVTGLHPFDGAYNRWFRGEGPEIPHYGSARRFTFGLATAWLIGTGLAFALGATVVGTFMGLIQIGNALSATTIYVLPPASVYSIATRGRAR